MNIGQLLEDDANLKNFISELSKDEEVEEKNPIINTNTNENTNKNVPIKPRQFYPREDRWSKLARQQEMESIKFAEEQHARNLKKNIYVWEVSDDCSHTGGIVFANNIREASTIITENNVSSNFRISPLKKGKTFQQLFVTMGDSLVTVNEK